MRPESAAVIVYDLDGTLVAGDVGKAFLHHLIESVWWRRIGAAVVAPVLFPMLRVGRWRRPAISAFLWIGTVGRVDDVAALARRFAADRPLEVLPTATAALRADLAGAARVVVATGAWEELAAVVLARLELPRKPELVASRTRVFLGGLVVGRQCNGHEKIDVLRAEGLAPPFARAITDAWLDWPLLAAAEVPVLVTDSDRLAERMRRQVGSHLQVVRP